MRRVRGGAVGLTVVLLAIQGLASCGGGKEYVPGEDVKGTEDAVTPLDVRGGEDAAAQDQVPPQDVGETVCVPKCDDKECGPDGCGGECGTCPAAAPECKAGFCAVPCEPDCEGKECGPDGCGGECGKCPNAAPFCVDSVCSVDCTPDCEGKQCGPDGCGGACGFCGAQELCSEGQCVCQPDCAAKECGSDSCGGSCGTCPADKPFCDGHFCTNDCQPDCTGKECGDDGCGGSCGKCGSPQEKCELGQCICVPVCGPKECGSDGCGGECGTCPAGTECMEGKCSSPCLAAQKAGTHIGCEFFAVDLDNVEGGALEPVALIVLAPAGNQEPALLEVTGFKGPAPALLTAKELGVTALAVNPGEALTLLLPAGYDIDGTVLNNRSVRLKSTQPVAAYQFNPLNGDNVFTNDASLLFPTWTGGTEYLALSWGLRVDENGGYTLRGFVTVVATSDGVTTVQVMPTAAVVPGVQVLPMAANPPEPYVFSMDQGDVLNLEVGGIAGSDLTGTRIVASQKVQVIGGHECGNVPLGTNYCDHLEQQLPPVSAWGNHFIGDPFKLRSDAQKDVWRVLAGQDGVKVTIVPPVGGPATLQAGEWIEFASGKSFELTATGPVLLGHYMQGSNYAGYVPHPACNQGSGIGDPAMTIVFPTSSFLAAQTVLTPGDYTEDFINVVAPAGAGKNVLLDGAPVQATFAPAGSGAFEVAVVPVGPGVHQFVSPLPIGLTVYGYDCDVSYAYPGGGKITP
jgi:hypothetical protein